MPSAAETFVELHQREQLVQLSLHQAEFSGEVIGVVGEHLEVAGGAACISQMREPGCVLGRVDQELLLFAELLGLAIGDQRVRDVAEGALNGFLIKEHAFLLPGFGKTDV